MRIVIAIGILLGACFIYLSISEVAYRKKYWRRRP